MWRLGLIAASLAVPACQFDRPADIMAIDARDLDAVDAPPPCTPSTIVCDDAQGVYLECDAAGAVVRQLECPLGCAADTEQCLDIDPHNGLAMYLDMVADPPDLIVSGPIEINTLTGAIFENSAPRTIPSFLSPNGLRVFVVRDARFASTVDVVRSAGAPGLALLATGPVVIEGHIDVSANAALAGPGGVAPASADSDCTSFNLFTPGTTGTGGGGGAGGSTIGGAGGSATGSAGGLPGPVHPLGVAPLGGCAGQSFFENGSELNIVGGAGGGALQVTSRRSITLTASAVLDASGGGAHSTLPNRPGAGGGAGGTILLEAPSVSIDGPNVILSVKGGGGGGAGSATLRGGDGSDGQTDEMPARGGSTLATGAGGQGGATVGPQNGNSGLASDHHGGGGGGATGRIAVFTSTGNAAPQNGAALRGPLVTGFLGTRRVP